MIENIAFPVRFNTYYECPHCVCNIFKSLDRITLKWVFVKLIENSGPSTLINATPECYEKFHFQGSLDFLWEIFPAEKFYWLYYSFPIMDQIWKYLWKTIYLVSRKSLGMHGWKHCNWGHPDLFLKKCFIFTWSITYMCWRALQTQKIKLQRGKS